MRTRSRLRHSWSGAPADNLIVPYRENRAVLFESRLFHRSDAPEFATGYENHRINLTLLFGRSAN